ncbi:CHAT domain-containing protein [Dactylosporangium sp. NPDC049140]|uniref:CHAT domain-containing protein n=1 Tax=Dactylosporangium sp. NPDC049140 TaxID=3155647 RepID=UPI0033E7AD5C
MTGDEELLQRYLEAPTWEEALSSPAPPAAWFADSAARAESESNDGMAGYLRRHAAVLAKLDADGYDAALALARGRIDPEEPKDFRAWLEVIADLEPEHLAGLLREHPWLLSGATGERLTQIVGRAAADGDLARLVDVEYRRLLLHCARHSGVARTVAALGGGAGGGDGPGDPDLQMLRKLALVRRVWDTEPARFALHDVAAGFVQRYHRTGGTDDLAIGLLLYRTLLDALGEDDRDFAAALSGNLAGTLQLWERATGEVEHRPEAVEHYRRYLALSDPADPRRPSIMVELAGVLLRTGGPGAPAEARELVAAALPRLAGHNAEQHIIGLIHLATADLDDFRRGGDPAAARASTAAAADAIAARPAADPDRRRLADALGQTVMAMLQARTDPGLLDAANRAFGLAADAAGTGSPEVDVLLNQASMLVTRFEERGAEADLDEAIRLARAALARTGAGHPQEPYALDVLGSALRQRFLRAGDIRDLDTSVEVLRRAVEVQGDAIVVPAALTNLGNAMLERYQHTRRPEDLDEGVTAFGRIVAATGPGDPARGNRVSGLAAVLRLRAKHRGRPDDLDRAIALLEEVLAAASPDQRGAFALWTSMGLALRDRYMNGGDDADIRRAAELTRAAAERTPATAATLPHVLTNHLLVLLAPALRARERTGAPVTDLDRWLTVTLRQASARARAGGDVAAALAGIVAPPAEGPVPTGDEPPDRPAPNRPGPPDPEAAQDDGVPRSLLGPPARFTTPEYALVAYHRAEAALERYMRTSRPADLDEAVRNWHAVLDNPNFAAVDRAVRRTLATAATRVYHAAYGAHPDGGSLGRLVDGFRLMYDLTDEPGDRRTVALDLARAHITRFGRIADPADLDRAFAVLTAAMDPAEPGDPMWRQGLRYLVGTLQEYPEPSTRTAAHWARLDLVAGLLDRLGDKREAPAWVAARAFMATAFAELSKDPHHRAEALQRARRIAPAEMLDAIDELAALAGPEAEGVEVSLGDLQEPLDDPRLEAERVARLRIFATRIDPATDYEWWLQAGTTLVLALMRQGDADAQDEALGVAEAIAREAAGHDDRPMHVLALAMIRELYGERIHGNAADNRDRAVAAAQRQLALCEPGTTAWAGASAQLGAALSRRAAYGRPGEGDAERAIACCRAAVEALGADARPDEAGMVHFLLGNVLLDQVTGGRAENMEAAIAAYRTALEYLPATEPAGANAHHQLGIAFTNRLRGGREDNLRVAVGHFEAELDVFTRERHPRDWALAQVSLGNAYSQAYGDDPRRTAELAGAAFTAALTVFTRDTDAYQWARIRNSQGLLAMDADGVGGRPSDPDAALAHFSAALEVYDRDRFPVDWARVQEYLAVCELSLGRPERSAEHAEAVLARYAGQGHSIEEGRARVSLAGARIAQAGRDPAARDRYLTEAVRHLETALVILAGHDMTAGIRDAATELAEAYGALGWWAESVRAFETGIAAAEAGYSAALLRASRSAELEHGRRLVRIGVRALVAAGRPADAAVALERGRARWLGESVARDAADLDRLALDHPGLAAGFRAAAAQVSAAEALERRAAGGDTLSEAGRARAALDAQLARIQRLAGYERFLDLPGLGDIERAVEAGRPLVYLLPAHDGTVVLLAHRTADGDLDVRDHAAPGLTLDGLDELLFGPDGFLAAQLRGGEQLRGALARLLDDLGERLMGPVAAALAGVPADGVAIVAAGRLGVLPLHAARYDTPHGRRCLLDDHAVSYTPSAWMLANTRAAEPATAVLAGVGDPTGDLPFAGGELADIAALFPPQSRVLYGDAATAPAVRAALPGATHVHFACHGGYDLADPLASALVLAGGDELTLRELLDGQLLRDARLVVASACQTAISNVLRLPDEALGLPAGFLRAGAAAVVGTLWPVADLPTALLMHRFYTHLLGAAGTAPLRPAAALRAAQHWLIRLSTAELAALLIGAPPAAPSGDEPGPFADPYFWAGFVLAGQ